MNLNSLFDVPMLLGVSDSTALFLVIAFHLFDDANALQDFAYSMFVAHVLLEPLIGFFGAVLFGAVLSRFNSALNSASIMFCLNIYKQIFSANIDDKKLVDIGKLHLDGDDYFWVR